MLRPTVFSPPGNICEVVLLLLNQAKTFDGHRLSLGYPLPLPPQSRLQQAVAYWEEEDVSEFH